MVRTSLCECVHLYLYALSYQGGTVFVLCSCAFMCVHGFTCVYMGFYVCTGVFMCVDGFTCLYMSFHVCACLWVNICLFVYSETSYNKLP